MYSTIETKTSLCWGQVRLVLRKALAYSTLSQQVPKIKFHDVSRLRYGIFHWLLLVCFIFKEMWFLSFVHHKYATSNLHRGKLVIFMKNSEKKQSNHKQSDRKKTHRFSAKTRRTSLRSLSSRARRTTSCSALATSCASSSRFLSNPWWRAFLIASSNSLKMRRADASFRAKQKHSEQPCRNWSVQHRNGIVW